MPTTNVLNVFRGAELVGSLFDEEPMRFVYADRWLQKPETKCIAPDMEIKAAEHTGAAVVAYFENLLPEAAIRDFLKIKYQTSTTFGLLSAIGGDTAGDLSLLPAGKSPSAPQYRDASWEQIGILFSNPQAVLNPTQIEEGVRISLAGAQAKTSIYIHADGTPAIPLASSPATHILKPDIKGIDSVWSSALNETFIMKLAKAVGIGVADVEYQPVVKACLVKRYDRMLNDDGTIVRLHQLDLCQLDGKLSTIKYESEGGPSLARCYQILRENGVPASDLKRFVQWIFFNLFVGNHDSHAKNLAIYYPYDEGARLTPFYDLLSTSLYAGLSRTFAFKIGGENLPGKINSACIIQMCDELNIKPKYALHLAHEVAEEIKRHLDDISMELARVAKRDTEQTLLERLSTYVKSNTKKVNAKLV